MGDHAEIVRNHYRRQGAVAEREELLKIIEAEIKRVPETLYQEGLREAVRIIKDRFIYADERSSDGEA